jgi:hypothetical protein
MADKVELLILKHGGEVETHGVDRHPKSFPTSEQQHTAARCCFRCASTTPCPRPRKSEP